MHRAFRNVRKNRGAAGIDKVSITMFEANLEQNLLALMRDLKTRGAFQPLPLRRVHIPKGPGQTRPLGIPAVRDRVAQEVLRQLLSPLFERLFHDDSYGFRPGRNCHHGRAKGRWNSIGSGYTHVLDADIKGFFDNLPACTSSWTASARRGRRRQHSRSGRTISQGRSDGGGRVSAHAAGHASRGGHIPLARQHCSQQPRLAPPRRTACASCAMPTTSWSCAGREAQVQEAHDLVQQHLTSLGLSLSAEKTKTTQFREGFAFLGFDISAWSITMRPKSVEKFKTKVRELTPRHHNLDEQVIQKLNRVIRGTANYFATAFSNVGDCFRGLDRWIRMRLRCMKYKRKSRADNGRIRLERFRRMGLLFLTELATDSCVGGGSTPRKGQSLWRRPVLERGSPVNVRELTSPRQRGGRGLALSLTHLIMGSTWVSGNRFA